MGAEGRDRRLHFDVELELLDVVIGVHDVLRFRVVLDTSHLRHRPEISVDNMTKFPIFRFSPIIDSSNSPCKMCNYCTLYHEIIWISRF